MVNTHPHIFFHVGTGKTGTTFLQYHVFPYFENIEYIQRTKYKKAKSIIRLSSSNKFLVSREFDQQLEEEVRYFSQTYPNTIPIIVFRRHDSYVASQFRRFVKNGFRGDFRAFFDLKNDTGYFKKNDLNFSHQISILEKYFNQNPIVLNYDDLKAKPKAFIQTIANLLDVNINISSLNLNPKHRSYSTQQLKAIQWVGQYINIKKRTIFNNKGLELIPRFLLSIIRYGTLYISKYLPSSWFDNTPLISEKVLIKIRDHYASDWQKVKSLVQNV